MKKICLIMAILVVFTVCFSACGNEKPYDYDLGEYITLGTYPEVKYSEEEFNKRVDEDIESIASEYAEVEEIKDRATQDGDTVNIDYVGKIDGKEFDGGTAENQNLKLGSDSYIGGFEDGLIGKNTGDEVVLNLTFPSDYKEPEYAGKAVEFTVKINKITSEVIPQLTDEMVQEHTKYSTVADFLEAVKKGHKEDIIWENYLKSCKVNKYPEKEVKTYYDKMISSYSQMALYNAMTLEQMVTSYYGYSTLDAFLDFVMDSAMNTVKEEMVAYHTARQFNVEVTDEEYKTLGEEAAVEAGYEKLKDYEEYVSKDYIKLQILMDKLVANTIEAQ